MASELGGLSLILDSHIAELVIDQPGRKVNALGRDLLVMLDQSLASIEVRKELRGLLVRSGKPGQFVAGADLKEILHLTHESPGQIAALIALGHRVFNRLSRLPIPTVALIDGPCLGGGLELALCCDARIVADHEATILGLPEVGIALIPSGGGTQRLPRLIDPAQAARLVLSGRKLTAVEAVELGLADEKCPPAELLDFGHATIARYLEQGAWPGKRAERAGRVPSMPCDPPWDRPSSEAGSPAAFDAAWQALSEGAKMDLPQALAREAEIAVPLFLEDEARARIHDALVRRHR